MIHYFYGTLQVGIGQTLCSFEHVSCSAIFFVVYNEGMTQNLGGLNIITSPLSLSYPPFASHHFFSYLQYRLGKPYLSQCYLPKIWRRQL